MNTLKALIIGIVFMIFGMSAYAQTSDHDLLFTELYNSEFPSEDGSISLTEGISGDYELLNYNILGDLDAVEGLDGAVILVEHSEDGDDYYLYAVLSEASFPNIVAYTLLGRDIVLFSLSISEGQIIADFVAEDLPSRQVYELDADVLNLLSEGELEEGHPFVADEELSFEELGNISYPLDWFDVPLTLTDGSFERTITTPDGDTTFSYRLVEDAIAYGDLNGDGAEDAMVYIAMTVEGYADEYWLLAAVLNHHGYPQFTDSEVDRLGSGARLEELSIDENGQVTFKWMELTHQALVQMHYVLEDGKLVIVER